MQRLDLADVPRSGGRGSAARRRFEVMLRACACKLGLGNHRAHPRTHTHGYFSIIRKMYNKVCLMKFSLDNVHGCMRTEIAVDLVHRREYRADALLPHVFLYRRGRWGRPCTHFGQGQVTSTRRSRGRGRSRDWFRARVRVRFASPSHLGRVEEVQPPQPPPL